MKGSRFKNKSGRFGIKARVMSCLLALATIVPSVNVKAANIPNENVSASNDKVSQVKDLARKNPKTFGIIVGGAALGVIGIAADNFAKSKRRKKELSEIWWQGYGYQSSW